MISYIKKFIFIISISLFLQISFSYAQQKLPEALPAKNVSKIDEKTLYEKYPSLMLNKRDLEYIDNALKSSVAGIPLKVLLPDLFSSDLKIGLDIDEVKEEEVIEEDDKINEEKEKTHEAYYLGSILYFGENNWSFWLNGEKITNENNSRFKVLEINSNYLILSFLPAYERIDVSWNGVFSSNYFANKYLYNKDNLVLDSDSRKITFILRPNQTFLASSLLILDGKPQISSKEHFDSLKPVAPEDFMAYKKDEFSGNEQITKIISLIK